MSLFEKVCCSVGFEVLKANCMPRICPSARCPWGQNVKLSAPSLVLESEQNNSVYRYRLVIENYKSHTFILS